MDAKFKEVCCNIRACLNSSKRQSSLAELSRDYKSVLGESIPYQSLRYPSLEALIRDVPQLKISRVGNEIFIDVKPDEKTMHISKLVRDQKTAKKKSKKKPNFGRVYRGAPPPRRSYNDPPRNSYRPPPPPRSNDYYPTRNRDPPPRQPVAISSEEEDTHEKIISRYRSSQPSQYDFSDPNESIDEGSDFEDANEINDKMEALNVTLKYENRQVKVNKTSNQKVRGYHSTTSNDDDIGYGSMRTSGSRNGYKSSTTDWYDEDDDDGYPSIYDSTGNSSSTTDPLESTNSVRSYSTNAKAPFGHARTANVNQLAAQSRKLGRGCRPYVAQSPNTYHVSTNYSGDCSSLGKTGNKGVADIKVTVPNGSGRARVVAFLCR